MNTPIPLKTLVLFVYVDGNGESFAVDHEWEDPRVRGKGGAGDSKGVNNELGSYFFPFRQAGVKGSTGCHCPRECKR